MVLQQVATRVTAAELARKLIKKIEHGIERLDELLREGPLPAYFAGNPATESSTAAGWSSSACYDDIRRVFESEASKSERRSDTWRFSAWCSNFNAGTLDSIAHLLPARRIESQDVGEEGSRLSKSEKDAMCKARKRRRNFATLVNSIVHRLPGESPMIYLTLASKSVSIHHSGVHADKHKAENYQFTQGNTISDSVYSDIASTVVQHFSGQCWLLPNSQGPLYDPTQVLCVRAQLPYVILSIYAYTECESAWNLFVRV